MLSAREVLVLYVVVLMIKKNLLFVVFLNCLEVWHHHLQTIPQGGERKTRCPYYQLHFDGQVCVVVVAIILQCKCKCFF